MWDWCSASVKFGLISSKCSTLSDTENKEHMKKTQNNIFRTKNGKFVLLTLINVVKI